MFKDLYFVIPFGMAVLALIIAAAAVYVALADVSHLLVIHFDTFRGIDFLGTRGDIWGILAVGAAIAVINFLLGLNFYHRERFFTYALSFATAFIALLILLGVGVILSIN